MTTPRLGGVNRGGGNVALARPGSGTWMSSLRLVDGRSYNLIACVWTRIEMKNYDASTYGEQIADIYDEWPSLPKDTKEAVEFLACLAGKGPVLELGVGTGRLALPLADRGVDVRGIDASPAMVEKLRSKPGGSRVPVVIGDFADLRVEGKFSLIFAAFNTFFALLSRDEQARCFSRVAERLAPEGVFVIEAFVPDPSRFDRGQRVSAQDVGAGFASLEVSIHDSELQLVRSQHVVITKRGIRLYPVHIRYAWVSELDLMAHLAGLRLRERFGGWKRELFSASSVAHVSVYERAPGSEA